MAILLFGLAVALTFIWVRSLTVHGLPWWGCLFAHFGVSGLASEAVGFRMNRELAWYPAEVRRSAWLLALGFPIFGLLIVGYWLIRPPSLEGTGHAESLQSQRARAAGAAYEARRAEQELGSAIESIVDALSDRDPQVRIAAIDSLRGQTSQTAVKILKEARENSIFDVRVRAVEALGRISKHFGDKLGQLRKQLEKDAGDPNVNYQLAATLLEYNKLKLEAAQMTKPLLKQALGHATTAADNGQPKAKELMGQLMLNLGDYEGAESLFAQQLKTKGVELNILQGLVEAQFQRKDFRALAKTAALPGIRMLDEKNNLREFLKMWTPHESENA